MTGNGVDIYTDDHGRLRVRFDLDLEGARWLVGHLPENDGYTKLAQSVCRRLDSLMAKMPESI